MARKITRVKKDNYCIVAGDEYVHIQGDSKETYDKGPYESKSMHQSQNQATTIISK